MNKKQQNYNPNKFNNLIIFVIITYDYRIKYGYVYAPHAEITLILPRYNLKNNNIITHKVIHSYDDV